MPESYLVVVICVAGAAFFFWSQQYLKKKVAEVGKAEEYKQKKAVVAGVAHPILGALFIGMVLFNWNSMPLENRGFAYAFIVTGVALILYGVYRMRRNKGL